MRHGPRVCREIVRAKIRRKAEEKMKDKKIDANKKTQMLKESKEQKEEETVWYHRNKPFSLHLFPLLGDCRSLPSPAVSR